MQTGSEQLKRQQEIMQVLGYYDGAIDGIWSDKTIAAKRKWESSGRFNPAIPNRGMPLGNVGKLPLGVTRDSLGLLTCYELQQKYAADSAAFTASNKAATTSTAATESSAVDDVDNTKAATTNTK